MALSNLHRASALGTGSVVIAGNAKDRLHVKGIKAADLGGEVQARPMKRLPIDPDTTASMTRKAAATARRVARPDTQIVTTNPTDGPGSVAAFYDVAPCLPGLLDEAGKHCDVDARRIACFEDTGRDAMRCLLDMQVIDIGEAVCHAATMLAHGFSVVTTLSRPAAGISENSRRCGLDAGCASVRATDSPVLKLEDGDPAPVDRMCAESRRPWPRTRPRRSSWAAPGRPI